MAFEIQDLPDVVKIISLLELQDKKKIPKKQLGLWTALPPGKEHYAELICDTFEHVFFNSA